jgi:hypothetical protein
MLDRHFRLYREDMVAPMRDALQTQLALTADKRRFVFDDLRVEGLLENRRNPRPCLTITVRMPVAMKKRVDKEGTKQGGKKLRDFWDSGGGRRVLGRDTIVLLVHDGQVVNIGVVVDRNADTMAVSCSEGRLSVGVGFFNEFDLRRALHMLIEQREGDVFLFQGNTSYFSYRPVLAALQRMSSIPFSSELVHYTATALSTGLAHAALTYETLPQQLQDAVRSDPSQIQALELALRQSVALIQGPPGTGKTHVGVVITQAMLHAAENTGCPLTILCCCYTNHALDNFLEALIDAGVNQGSIVRMGSSKKSSDRL